MYISIIILKSNLKGLHMARTASNSNISIALRGQKKGSTRFMNEKRFYNMISNNLKVSFELEGIKRTDSNHSKIKLASSLLKELI